MKELKVKLTGMAPILFHNVNSMDLKKPAKITHAEWEESNEVFKSRLYFDLDSKMVLPTRMILGMMKVAAQKSGIKQAGKRSTYANLIRAVLFLQDNLKLDQKEKEVLQHREYVTINRSKVLRVFPTLIKWSGTITLIYDDTQISEEVLLDILNYGGSYVGVGDYRPEYGRFTVKKMKK